MILGTRVSSNLGTVICARQHVVRLIALGSKRCIENNELSLLFNTIVSLISPTPSLSLQALKQFVNNLTLLVLIEFVELFTIILLLSKLNIWQPVNGENVFAIAPPLTTNFVYEPTN